MIQEIYCGIPNSNSYKPYTIEITDDIDTILQRVRVVLGTTKGDVLGDPDFGINLEDYLFEMNIPEAQVKKEILNQITKYVKPGTNPMYSIDVKVNFGKTSSRDDYMIVDIFINQQKRLGILVGA